MKTVSISETPKAVEPENVKPEDDTVDLLDDSDDCEDDDDDMQSDFSPNVDLGQLLSNFFVTENGINVADALMEVKASLDIHNKLVHKLIKIKEARR